MMNLDGEGSENREMLMNESLASVEWTSSQSSGVVSGSWISKLDYSEAVLDTRDFSLVILVKI